MQIDLRHLGPTLEVSQLSQALDRWIEIAINDFDFDFDFPIRILL